SLAAADQRARDRRRDRNAALTDVGLVLAGDLIDHPVAFLLVLELDRGAEHHLARVGQRPGIDDLGIGELRFELADPALDEALLFASGVVLRVLRQIAMAARLRDGLD